MAIVQGHSLLETVYVATAKGEVPSWSPWYLLYAMLTSLASVVIGVLVFRRFSGKFVEMA